MKRITNLDNNKHINFLVDANVFIDMFRVDSNSFRKGSSGEKLGKFIKNEIVKKRKKFFVCEAVLSEVYNRLMRKEWDECKKYKKYDSYKKFRKSEDGKNAHSYSVGIINSIFSICKITQEPLDYEKVFKKVDTSIDFNDAIILQRASDSKFIILTSDKDIKQTEKYDCEYYIG